MVACPSTTACPTQGKTVTNDNTYHQNGFRPNGPKTRTIITHRCAELMTRHTDSKYQTMDPVKGLIFARASSKLRTVEDKHKASHGSCALRKYYCHPILPDQRLDRSRN